MHTQQIQHTDATGNLPAHHLRATGTQAECLQHAKNLPNHDLGCWVIAPIGTAGLWALWADPNPPLIIGAKPDCMQHGEKLEREKGITTWTVAPMTKDRTLWGLWTNDTRAFTATGSTPCPAP